MHFSYTFDLGNASPNFWVTYQTSLGSFHEARHLDNVAPPYHTRSGGRTVSEDGFTIYTFSNTVEIHVT